MNHQADHTRKPTTLARSLGVLSIALGAAQWIIGRRLARLRGLQPSFWKSATFHALGASQILSGISALLIRGRASKPNVRPTLRSSITVDRMPSDVYAFWRSVENFPSFISQLESVTSPDQIRSRWKIRLTNSTLLELEATIVEDTPGQRLVWKVKSPTARLLIDIAEIRFELAPGGRGTEVHVVLHGSPLQRTAATLRWLHKLPQGILYDQLHRFKQRIELGEVTQSDTSVQKGSYPARPGRSQEFPREAATFESAPTNPNLTSGGPS